MAEEPTHSEVRHREVEARSITRTSAVVDPWFLARYGMNLYRGCEHGCLYCDGRAERYHVDGCFDRDIEVKANAVELLDRELARIHEPGFLFVGGGVSDAWQQADARWELARGVLGVALRRRLPVHVLTKSALVERDLDLLAELDAQRRAILSFSIHTTDEQVRERFEPGAAPIADRLRLMRRARDLGLGVGAMALPVLPGLSDQPAHIDALVAALVDAGAHWIAHGGLTLRPGRQKQAVFDALAIHHPDLVAGYKRLYRDEHASGAPDRRYLERVDERFASALARHGLPGRPPRHLFTGQMPLYAEVGVLLEHREHELRLEGRPGRGLGRSGWSLQQWARKLVSARARRGGFHYSQVEDTFLARVRDGSLAEVEGIGPAALEEVTGLLGPRAAMGGLL